MDAYFGELMQISAFVVALESTIPTHGKSRGGHEPPLLHYEEYLNNLFSSIQLLKML